MRTELRIYGKNKKVVNNYKNNNTTNNHEKNENTIIAKMHVFFIAKPIYDDKTIYQYFMKCEIQQQRK